VDHGAAAGIWLAAAYYRWTADLGTLSALRPGLDAALDLIENHGDRDGDRFLEYRYQRRSPASLQNQGWKDSKDAVTHADGRSRKPNRARRGPRHSYLAKLRTAAVGDAFGERDRGRELRAQAQALRDAFNDATWNLREGTLALALDGRKRRVATAASNRGHCLYCDIAEAAKAAALAERLMNSAIIASGLKHYGYSDATLRIATAVFDIAARARDSPLAELRSSTARRHLRGSRRGVCPASRGVCVAWEHGSCRHTRTAESRVYIGRWW
jgi:hypothetical protein